MGLTSSQEVQGTKNAKCSHKCPGFILFGVKRRQREVYCPVPCTQEVFNQWNLTCVKMTKQEVILCITHSILPQYDHVDKQ